MVDKKFLTRSINRLYRGFEQFARNETQRTALIEMQIVTEDVLDIEPRHRVCTQTENTTRREHTMARGEERRRFYT